MVKDEASINKVLLLTVRDDVISSLLVKDCDEGIVDATRKCEWYHMSCLMYSIMVCFIFCLVVVTNQIDLFKLAPPLFM